MHTIALSWKSLMSDLTFLFPASQIIILALSAFNYLSIDQVTMMSRKGCLARHTISSV